VKQLSPERLMTKAEWLQRRRNEFVQIIKELWPEKLDRYPTFSAHFEEELDVAIRLLRLRRTHLRDNRPAKKKKPGAQKKSAPRKWTVPMYRELLIIHNRLREDPGLKGTQLLDEIGKTIGINGHNKIKKRLQEARKLKITDVWGTDISAR
jgi:hypothetical protein